MRAIFLNTLGKLEQDKFHCTSLHNMGKSTEDAAPVRRDGFGYFQGSMESSSEALPSNPKQTGF